MGLFGEDMAAGIGAGRFMSRCIRCGDFSRFRVDAADCAYAVCIGSVARLGNFFRISIAADRAIKGSDPFLGTGGEICFRFFIRMIFFGQDLLVGMHGGRQSLVVQVVRYLANILNKPLLLTGCQFGCTLTEKVGIVQNVRVGGRVSKAPSGRGLPSSGTPDEEGGGECGTYG